MRATGAPPGATRNMTPSLPFTISGVTVHGKRLGTELGFPTANLDYPAATPLPPDGIYIAEAFVDGHRYASILNQGYHPTTPEGRATIETHLLDYAGGDMYGRLLTLRYLHFLRPEVKFHSLEALKAQMVVDKLDAIRWIEAHAPSLADAMVLNMRR